MSRKVCVVVTARPSYSRIRTALTAINRSDQSTLQLVVAGSALLDRYGGISKLIADDGFEITDRVLSVMEGESLLSMAKTAGLGIIELSSVFERLNPDMVITIADRFETISTAIAAAYMNIPLVHVQGGEVTGSIDEKVRHAITKLADIHLVSNNKAFERVTLLGEDSSKVFVTGCPSIDLAKEVFEDPLIGFEIFEKYGGVGEGEKFDLSEGYVVVMQHPVTTEYGDSGEQIMETLDAINRIGVPTFWFWPNVDAGSGEVSKGIREYRELSKPKNIHLFRNMEGPDFLRLLLGSRCIIGNSSVAIRECSFLGIPAVNIGSRQNGRERGKNVVDVNHASEAICSATQAQFDHGHYEQDFIYGNGNAGEAISEVLNRVELTIDKKLTYKI